MWCTRWFLPLLLLPLPTAPPFFLLLFLFTLTLHGRPCFYCIVLLAALFLSSCYWQSFPLDAHLSSPWAPNITTFSDALSAALPPHLNPLNVTPPIIRVADRCWCDFASGLFGPYDMQTWEMHSIQRAVAEIEKQWNPSPEQDSANATNSMDPQSIELQKTLNASSLQNETPALVFRSFFARHSIKSEPSRLFTLPDDASPLPETPTKSSLDHPSKPAESSLVPGQLDMRPFGFELIFDLRWSRRS